MPKEWHYRDLVSRHTLAIKRNDSKKKPRKLEKIYRETQASKENIQENIRSDIDTKERELVL
ncbi:6235_t:CDS:2 [Ambispora gerdemannii]|uniref:6235_t:CDS:1 n=1 Tax=Ambispora gerdemannii TaxID=144530 RepID=A0A9N8YN73_9GLOM|nr:6235_t:CDS:2 [Ambispora gerdemannii]